MTGSQCQSATRDLAVGRLDDLGGFSNCLVPDSGVGVGEGSFGGVEPGGDQGRAPDLRRHYSWHRPHQARHQPDNDEPVVIPLDVLVQYRRALCQLLESVGGSLCPVYPHDGDQVPFDLVQHPVRADAQPTVGAADERARRRWIVS